jgi:hypothetical protein
VLLFSLHLIAVMACFSAAYSPGLMFFVLLFISLHAFDAYLCWRFPPVNMLHYASGGWSLGLNPKAYRRRRLLLWGRCASPASDEPVAVDLLPSSWFTRYLGVLNYRSSFEFEANSLLQRCLVRLSLPTYSVVLCEDSADADELRYLRIVFRCC